MGGMDTAKSLCCTWKGVNKLKKMTAFVCGGLVIATGVGSFFSFESINPLHLVRAIWNIIFGVLMILVQLNWKKMITRNFGFLRHWFMRGTFYIFVGTNSMTWASGKDGSVTFWDVFSVICGFACIFVGTMELLFGFKCQGDADTGDDDKNRVDPTGVRVETGGPTLSVNVTPQQAVAGASFLAKNAGTVAAVANAAAGSSGGGSSSGGGGGGGGGASDNPFFGNSHLKNNP